MPDSRTLATEPKKNKTIDQTLTNKDALKLVQKRFAATKQYTQSYFTRFQRFYRLYRSYLQRASLPWRSNLFIPKTFEIIETVAPRIAQAQRTFKTLPVEGGDEGNSQAFTDLLKYQFQRTDMEDIIEELTKETLIYGTGVVKVTWSKDGLPNPEVVDIFDFYPDPKARSDQEFLYVIHRLERDLEDLKANGNYNPEALARLEEKTGKSEDDRWRKQRLGIEGIVSTDSTRKRFEVLEYHGEFNGKLALITIADNEVLRVEETSPYPWIPFVVVRDHIIPHELYGVGEVEPVESLQNELNDIRNQRMDNIKLNINSMWKIVAGGVQFEDELVSRPGGVVHLTRPDGLIPNDRQVVPSEAFTEESVIKSDMERATGANSSISGALVSPMGGTQGGVLNRTATAYQGAINQGDKRFTAKINQLKRGLIRIGRMFLELDQQFMTKEQVIRIIGDEGNAALIPISPEDIKGKFDLEVEIEYLDEFQQMQQDINLLQVLGQIPGFNVPQLAADILEKSGKKDVKKYLQPPPPPQPAPEQPKITYQIRGDMAPDAVAQLLDKTEGIRSNPEVVAAQMRATAMQEHQAHADILSTLPQEEQNATPQETAQPAQ